MTQKKIIDVSVYNGTIDWKKVKKYGCDGAIIKIIRKDLGKDKKFEANYKKCEELGIPWGVYNYTYATTVAKAKSDMKLVCDILDKISKKHFKYGVWFDIEDKVQAKLTKGMIASIINAAQTVVESRGYKFGVYTGKSYFAEHIDKNKLKPGDICFYRLHTNIFAGINENNKMVWWDAGKASTNTKKAGGIYKKIHRIINSNQKILYVLRWKG